MIRLADEYDEAKRLKQVQSDGGNRKVIIPDENDDLPSAADIGINPKDIHEGRMLREA